MILLTPGPVYVPKEIREAQTKEMITHRSEEMTELYSDLVGRSKKYLNSEESYIITGSGSIGLEALFANFCKPGDKTLCLANGVFGKKLGLTVGIYSEVDVHRLDAGQAWTLKRAKEIIDKSTASVFGMVYNETGYGVRNEAKEIVNYAKKKGMYTILDCISAWPGTPFDMKEFELDGFVTGVQKGLACPPGLSIVGVSRDGVGRIISNENVKSYYCDLKKYKERFDKNGQTPFTPAVSLMWALQKSFDMLDEAGGIKAAVKKHKELSSYVQKKVVELGFELIPEKGYESYTVTAFKGGDNAKAIRSKLKKEYNIWIVGCKGEYSENGLRISNMGYVTKEMLDSCLDAIKEIKG